MNKEKKLSFRHINKRIGARLPFIILIFASMCILLTESYDDGFVPGGFYSGVSVHGITLAKNLLNSKHPFFMFAGKELHDGRRTYEAYNRFPVFPFLITGLCIRPFKNNLAFQVYIARQLMNIFFILSIFIAFKLVDIIVKNKYLAISVVLLAFSSYYMLTYNDFVFNDIQALLGFILALYCVVKSQQAKLKISHILFYSLFPVSLGWQPYAVFIAWFLADAIDLFLKKDINIKMKIAMLIKQQSFVILLIAVAWGILILGLQLFNEWRIVGGSFLSLPSVSSGLWRTGIASAKGHTQFTWLFKWSDYLPGQSHAILIMLIPFWPIFQVEPGLNASIFIIVSFIIYILIKYLKDRESINKIHFVLIFSGIFWTIPMKQFASMHEFQSIFYIGFVISAYILLLSRVNSKTLKILAVDIAVAFLITTAFSNHLKTPNLKMNDLITQFQSIRNKLPRNSKVYFDGKRHKTVEKYAIDFLLTGYWFTQMKDADFVVSKNPDFNSKKLTDNTGFNLFKTGGLHASH